MKEKKVRKRLYLDDIKVLMKIRKLKSNPFTFMKSAGCWRPRTTLSEWNKIKAAREERELNVSRDDSDYARKICGNQSLKSIDKLNLLSERFNANSVQVSKIVKHLNLSLAASQFSKAMQYELPKKQRYLISSAQNASPVNLQLLENMKVYAKYIDAEIGIIATRYHNPTSVWNTNNERNDVWDEAVQEFLTAKRQQLHPKLMLLADLKVQATSPNPTNGTELMGNGKSCIVGAPRIEMRSLPVLIDQDQVFLYSTGTVTAPSFTDSVAGAKGEYHHSYGFIVVEIDGDEVHMRNVSASKDGSFNDLWFRVENGEISQEDAEAVVLGDSHFAQMDNEVTHANRIFMRSLGVSKVFLHDVFDSQSINVHNAKNPIIRHQLEMEGKDNLKVELDNMFEQLDWFSKNIKETVVVASNHDDFLDRAMYLADWRDNLKNANIFVDMLQLTLTHRATKGIVPYYINNRYSNITALGTDDSYLLYGVELGMHGHIGANGARGNINGFAKLPVKTIIGHSHSPQIKGGAYQVGISCSLQHGYNKGLSGWAYANCLLNKHGKRQMIVLNKKTLKYTTF